MRLKDLPFDLPTLKRVLGFFTVMMLACKFTQSAAYIVTLPIALWAMSTKNTVWLFTMLLYMSASLCTNTFFIPKTGLMVQMQRGEMIVLGVVMLTSIFGQKKAVFLTPFFGMFFYIAYMFCVSAKGWAPVISYMKLVLFVPVFFGFYGMAARVYVDERENINKLRSVVIAYAIYMMVYSVLLWPFPGISQLNVWDLTEAELASKMASLSLFKGMTQHSQVLGQLASMMGVIVLGDYLFSVRKHFWVYDVILLCILFCLIKSSSRTGMAALVAGWGILWLKFMQARGFKAQWKQKVTQIGGSAILVFVLAVLLVAPVRNKVMGFVLKYGGNDAQAVKNMTTEDILASRQGKLDGCIANWKQSPVIGNGFQVSENMKYIKNFKDLLSAPVEKSTWIYAILEEGGVIGEVIFVIWVVVALCLLHARHAHIGLACFVNLLFSNLGEFNIFSLSYTGATIWAMTFAGCVLDSQRYKLSRIVAARNAKEAAEIARQEAFEEYDAWQQR